MNAGDRDCQVAVARRRLCSHSPTVLHLALRASEGVGRSAFWRPAPCPVATHWSGTSGHPALEERVKSDSASPHRRGVHPSGPGAGRYGQRATTTTGRPGGGYEEATGTTLAATGATTPGGPEARSRLAARAPARHRAPPRRRAGGSSERSRAVADGLTLRTCDARLAHERRWILCQRRYAALGRVARSSFTAPRGGRRSPSSGGVYSSGGGEAVRRSGRRLVDEGAPGLSQRCAVVHRLTAHRSPRRCGWRSLSRGRSRIR